MKDETMQKRTRKRTTPTTFEECPPTGMDCATCFETGIRTPQVMSPHGATCKFGHGGAEGIPQERVVTHADIIEDEFVIREGDTMSVQYGGAKVSIKNSYSSVELDGCFFHRKLRPGDNAIEQHDKIYAFLKAQSEKHARPKLEEFMSILRRAVLAQNGGS